MAPQKPTVVLPTHKEERLELDDVEHDFIPFFDSLYSLDYADAYVESKTNFIRVCHLHPILYPCPHLTILGH